MAGCQTQKLTEKKFMNEVLPKSKRHELLKILVNLQWRIQGRGGGSWGTYACPLFVVFFYYISYNSEVYEQKIS